MAKEAGARGRYKPLFVCSGGFLVGALAGWLLASLIDADSRAAFSDFFLGYGSALSAGKGTPSLGKILWYSGKWPLFAFLLGFTALGVVMVPFLFALRGFFLSYCIAAMARAMAGRGALFALVLFGLEGLVSLPVLFVLGTQSWEAAGALGGRLVYTPKIKSPYSNGYWPRCLLCMIVLLLGTFAVNAAMPLLLRSLLAGSL